MLGSGDLTRAARLGAALCAALVASSASATPAARDGAAAGGLAPGARERVDLERAAAPPSSVRLAAVDPGAEGSSAPAIRYKDTPPPPGSWRRPTGKWLTAAGVVLLAGGVTVAAMNRRLSSDLEHKYLMNELTPADGSSYDRIDAYNTWTTVLLATGAAATGAGLYLWGTAPEVGPGRRATVGVQGRF